MPTSLDYQQIFASSTYASALAHPESSTQPAQSLLALPNTRPKKIKPFGDSRFQKPTDESEGTTAWFKGRARSRASHTVWATGWSRSVCRPETVWTTRRTTANWCVISLICVLWFVSTQKKKPSRSQSAHLLRSWLFLACLELPHPRFQFKNRLRLRLFLSRQTPPLLCPGLTARATGPNRGVPAKRGIAETPPDGLRGPERGGGRPQGGLCGCVRWFCSCWGSARLHKEPSMPGWCTPLASTFFPSRLVSFFFLSTLHDKGIILDTTDLPSSLCEKTFLSTVHAAHLARDGENRTPRQRAYPHGQLAHLVGFHADRFR